MEVSALLKLMGNLSLGNDHIDQVEREIFLTYLNLAHLEMYRETANFNQELLTQVALNNDEGSNQTELPKSPYLISAVYDLTHKSRLLPLSESEVVERDLLKIRTGAPTHFVLKGNVLEFFPKQTAVISIKVCYISQPTSLTEKTPEEDIPYPLAYHPLLADGALYYLFCEEGGFKNPQKAQEAQRRWSDGKSRLLAHLYNSGTRKLSTFSNV